MPVPDQPHCEYLPLVFQKHLATLKSKVVGERVIIIVGETTDSRKKSVLNVLVWLKDGSTFLVDVQYPEAANHAVVAQKVLIALTELGVNFNHVLAVVSDSAAYMLKCHRVVLLPVLHIQCMSHAGLTSSTLLGIRWYIFES